MAELKDSTGRYLTKALFVEYSDGSFKPEFTLKDEDLPTGEKSLRRIYMDYEDPTEGKFAKEVLGSLQHWKKLCKTAWFKPHVDAWREDLEELLVSKGVAEMKKHAPKSAVAAKWLAERGWKPGKRGRPSEEDVAQERKQIAEDRNFYDNAASRVFDDED